MIRWPNDALFLEGAGVSALINPYIKMTAGYASARDQMTRYTWLPCLVLFNKGIQQSTPTMSTAVTTTMSPRPARVLTANSHDQTDLLPAERDQAFQSLARGDRHGTLQLRGIPTFTDPHAKRQWIREHMAAAFRFFGKRGYGEGISGHISVRGKTGILGVEDSKWEQILPGDLTRFCRPGAEGPFLDEPVCATLLDHQGLGSGAG